MIYSPSASVMLCPLGSAEGHKVTLNNPETITELDITHKHSPLSCTLLITKGKSHIIHAKLNSPAARSLEVIQNVTGGSLQFPLQNI